VGSVRHRDGGGHAGNKQTFRGGGKKAEGKEYTLGKWAQREDGVKVRAVKEGEQ